jgi:pimeloyl-ACP methyl ester carboxylesterase
MVRSSAELKAGVLEYEDTGGPGPVVVLLHGLVMDGAVWHEVVRELGDGYRFVLPVLPFGAHRVPMRDDADLSLRGVAGIVAELLDRLELSDVTLCFNDWGGAQVMIAERLMERVGRLVLTSCEAYDNYPPGIPGRLASLSAKLPGGIAMMRRSLRTPALARLPIAFGRMSKRGIASQQMLAWTEPLARREIRRDLAKYAGDARNGRRAMLAASAALGSFRRPVLIAWAAEDRIMPPEHGRRLAQAFPDSTLVEIADSYTLVPFDQPRVLASHMRSFLPARSTTVQRPSLEVPPRQ